MNRSLCLLLATMALAAAFAAPASAGGVKTGPRFGYSIDPDQIVLGWHLMAPLAKALQFVPSGEIAFGDNATTWTINGDLHLNFKGGGVRPYILAGGTWASYDPDAEAIDSVDEFGGGVGAGIWFNLNKDTPAFIEGRYGFDPDKMPDFKIMAGLNL